MVVTFLGHSNIACHSILKEMVMDTIRKNTSVHDQINFYLGGYGNFDEICACACRELRKEYSQIELVYVTPYMGIREQEIIKDLQAKGMYDTSVYPPLEGIPLRLAILKRNEWMIRNSDIIIAYITHNFGGAYKGVEYAKRIGKRVINLCEFL